VAKPVAGDIVVLPFPQTNLQAGKRRPALVVADLTGDD
jgi:mRNA interferase MazF